MTHGPSTEGDKGPPDWVEWLFEQGVELLDHWLTRLTWNQLFKLFIALILFGLFMSIAGPIIAIMALT